MDITLYISRFLYRIRHQVIFGSLAVTLLVGYFTQFLPKTYTVNTSIFTGIASNTGLDSEDKPDRNAQNNTFDNLINLTKAKGTLEKVSLRLFALNMIHGDATTDNLYITAKNFKELQKTVPEDVKKLIDKSSLEKTIKNLEAYKQAVPGNFLYGLFNWYHPNYSYAACKNVVVARLNNSDLIEISFKSNDPGIAMNTVKLINDELIKAYDEIRYKAANDVIKYYEDQLATLRLQLDNMENSLTTFNTDNGVINYGEQTKAIALAYTSYEDRYEAILREYESSNRLIQQLEQQMDIRSKLFQTNTEFVAALDSISYFNEKITEIETFNAESVTTKNKQLEKYKSDLKNTEKKIEQLSDEINEHKYSKEGVAIENMVNHWLAEVIRNTKAKAELKILDNRRKDFVEQYKRFSPVGTQINRKEREIHITEESYLETLHALNMAKLKQKNIQLTSATLNAVTPPTYPLSSDKSKRSLFTLVACLGSIIFIIGCNLVVELLDRTLRDAERTQRLTGTSVLGAFTGNTQLKYRGYIKACNRISAAYACNRMNQYLHPEKTTYINLLSIESREGKSFVADYLIDNWQDQGLKVRHLKIGEDLPNDCSFLLTSGYDALLSKEEERPDILLLELPAVQNNSLPASLLRQADVNLLIANACRSWKQSDQTFLNHLKEMATTAPFYIYLNNATRETVEEFTGQLPPYTSMRTLANRLIYMGLTAQNTAIK